jgi:hypothetical protein
MGTVKDTHGLTPTAGSALRWLADPDPRPFTVGQSTSRYFRTVHPATADLLVDLGLVELHGTPGSSLPQKITLTDAGKALAEKVTAERTAEGGETR